MAERWPASMRKQTAAEYLDVSPATFERIASENHIDAVQLTERGDRLYLKEDLDGYLEQKRRSRVTGQRAA